MPQKDVWPPQHAVCMLSDVSQTEFTKDWLAADEGWQAQVQAAQGK
ncbi:MAG TPA: hypothetical protein PKD54_13460 [Pirellulaceae bacterium]|nr:hypothetical protein [Pirellulaceae bacterium]